MSKKRKKVARMSDRAQQEMYEFAKEKYELATRVTRGVDSVGSLAFAQHCSSYAKDGFKKGYDFGRREELAKQYNAIDIAKEFENELKALARRYGLEASVKSIEGHYGYLGETLDYLFFFNVSIGGTAYDIKKAYMERKMESCNTNQH